PGHHVKTSHPAALMTVSMAALLAACSPSKPVPDSARPRPPVKLGYDGAAESNRYFGSVQSRHEVDQAFRVGGKVAERRVDVGATVREGDVIAVLDDADYRLAEEALRRKMVGSNPPRG